MQQPFLVMRTNEKIHTNKMKAKSLAHLFKGGRHGQILSPKQKAVTVSNCNSHLIYASYPAYHLQVKQPSAQTVSSMPGRYVHHVKYHIAIGQLLFHCNKSNYTTAFKGKVCDVSAAADSLGYHAFALRRPVLGVGQVNKHVFRALPAVNTPDVVGPYICIK